MIYESTAANRMNGGIIGSHHGIRYWQEPEIRCSWNHDRSWTSTIIQHHIIQHHIIILSNFNINLGSTSISNIIHPTGSPNSLPGGGGRIQSCDVNALTWPFANELISFANVSGSKLNTFGTDSLSSSSDGLSGSICLSFFLILIPGIQQWGAPFCPHVPRIFARRSATPRGLRRGLAL